MGTQALSTSARVLDAIRRIVRVLRESSRTAEDALGLSGAQLFVLHRLGDRPLSMTELAARTLTHQSSVSAVVSRLVARGLVQRRTARGDARRVELMLTDKGRLLRERAPAAAQDRVIAGIDGLPARVQAQLADALEALVAQMGLEERAAEMFFEEPPPRPRRRAKKRPTRRS
jgi:DNA-binding MarR family transcriptional regulator